MAKNKEKKIAKGSKKSSFSMLYKQNYKYLLIIPIILFIASIASIANTYNQENSPIYRDVSLKGGLSAILEINPNIEAHDLENKLIQKFTQNSFTVSTLTENGKNTGYIIDTDLDESKLINELKNTFQDEIIQGQNYNSNFMSASLSNSFFKQAMIALVFSFVFMSLVVFLYFREFIPSSAVVLSAIFDIIVTIGILNFFEFKLSVAGIGAIIMLVGYSIDTDVLLTNRLVKEKGKNYFEKTFFAFKTGSLMSGTTLAACIGAIIITNSIIIQEIAIILALGLIVDYISTWIQNTGILLIWLENKK